MTVPAGVPNQVPCSSSPRHRVACWRCGLPSYLRRTMRTVTDSPPQAEIRGYRKLGDPRSHRPYAADMPTLTTLVLFGLASLALLLVPGPAVLYIVTRSVSQGRRAGLVSVLGVHVGSVVHVAAAALGLSALLASSATAFGVVKYLGAAYLVWLGLQKLRRSNDTGPVVAPPAAAPHRLFVQGIVVNVLNPKTAI